jgi:acyl-CoA synthetase (AMP-forming)/AMP-acid ligase II
VIARARQDTVLAAEAYRRELWVHTTLADSLFAAAESSPRRTVLVDGDTRLDCATLHTQATGLASALLARMPRGSVVSFMLPNWHEAAVIYLAATLAGMVANPILPSMRDRELRFILEDADSRIIFAPAHFGRHDYAAMLARVTSQFESPPEVAVVRGDPGSNFIPFASLLAGPSTTAELPALDPDAVRMILYTSGTTGRPKGVLHTHNSIHALICQIRDHWLVEPGDGFLVASPIAHIGGSIYAFECPLLLGTTAVLMDHWNGDDAVELMQAERCTHMAGATPFLEQMLTAAQRAGSRLPDLKLFVCGGASVSPSLIRRAAAYFEPAIITRVYGSTEVPVTTIGSLQRADHAADTDGHVGLADIKLVGGNEAGEIYARGPQMLVGYQHPEDDAESFDAEGYFRTGDLARWVDDEYLVVTGRAKDIIIRNGENISAKEVEDVLYRHPAIVDAAAVALPDPSRGELCCAVVVLAPGAAPLSLTDVDLHCRELGLARFKTPERLEIVAQLPRNTTGKVLKSELVERLRP